MRWQDRSVQFEGAVPFGGNLIFSINNATKPAKYIASRIGAPVPLNAPLHYYAIDADAVAALRSEYDVYLVNKQSEVSNTFYSIMESAGATWLSQDLPHPYEEVRAIFLPRAEPLSMRASQAFREAGFVDLGAHLEEVAKSDIPDVISKYLPHQDLDVDVEEERSTAHG